MHERLSFDDIHQSLRKVVKSPEGQRVLYRILAFTDPLQPTLTLDPMMMAHNSGRHDVHVGLRSAILTVAPESFMKMCQLEKEIRQHEEETHDGTDEY